MLQNHERLTFAMILLLSAEDYYLRRYRPRKEVEWKDCCETSSKLQTRRSPSGGKRKQHQKRFQRRLFSNTAQMSGADGTQNVVSERLWTD
jgi:hypothetical protein